MAEENMNGKNVPNTGILGYFRRATVIGALNGEIE